MVSNQLGETIVALGTPPGQGAVAVVRISGPRAGDILHARVKCRGGDPRRHPWRLHHGWFVDGGGEKLDEVLAVYFAGPRSYTGEDLVEIHCHGGPAVVEAITAAILKEGARPASRGEFTRRAFEAGRLDLTRAEAVLRVVQAETLEQLKGALAALAGSLAQRVRSLAEALNRARVEVEAGIDFPDEPEAAGAGVSDLRPMLARAEELRGDLRRRVEPGTEVVFAGRPNVGKSSLVNAMAGRAVSIVTAEPGTTRDAVCTDVLLAGFRVTLVDTAGLGRDREIGEADREAGRIARERAMGAGLLVWVTDDPQERPPPRLLRPERPWLWVLNKIDRLQPRERLRAGERIGSPGCHQVSARDGEGVSELSDRVRQKLCDCYGPPDGMPVSARQIDALDGLIGHIRGALRSIDAGQAELAAIDLQDAIGEAGRLLGEDVEDDVLDRIFEEFCIGK